MAGADVEWLHLIDYNIEYCRGCHTCLSAGRCPIDDDLQVVRDKLLAADGIRAGSPVYAGRPSAQMKTLIDRLTLQNLFAFTFDCQRSIGVATSGIAPTRGTAKEIANFFGLRTGVMGTRVASISRGYRDLAEARRPGAPGRARSVGHRLVEETESSKEGRPTLKALWIAILRQLFIRPLIVRNEDQFGGIIKIWRQKGWLKQARYRVAP